MSDTPVSKLEYLPAPEKPHGFDAEIAHIAGLAPNGESYLRVEWAMDVKENWGDVKVHRYPDSREPPKYVGMPYFVLEGWLNIHSTAFPGGEVRGQVKPAANNTIFDLDGDSRTDIAVFRDTDITGDQ